MSQTLDAMPSKQPRHPLSSRTPRLDSQDPATTRARLREYFTCTFDAYTHQFDFLKDERAFYQKAIILRHPLIFYLGHTATFFVNKFRLARLLDDRIDAHLESVFAVGVDEMSWDDLDDTHYDWPSVQAVLDYRAKVRAMVLDVIDKGELNGPVTWDHPWWAIIMGIEHERIHVETSAVLMRQHQLEYLRPLADWAPCHDAGDAPQNSLIKVAAGNVDIGKPRRSPTYGWDNEYSQHQADVEGFEAAKYLVSNGEFLQFVEAGGYRTKHYWQPEGWDWRGFEDRQHPEFWVKKPNGWHLRLIAEEVPMPWNWPAEVNYHEAKAFCHWKSEEMGRSIRLPTEDEWHRLHAVSGAPASDPQDSDWPANIQMEHWASPCPVDHFKQGDFYDVVGNVWQWTETPTYPFDGFKVHPYYDDFTMPTFDGEHNLIKGGSWISCGNEAQTVSRYAFRRHFFQFAGFRYIATEVEVKNPSSHYETDKLMSEYAEFHYGDSYFGVPNFPKALVDNLTPYLRQRQTRRALDLGCASGRASFELARYFEHVDGVDFSARFTNQGVQLNREGELRYALQDEGELELYITRKLRDLGLDQVPAPVFSQGDACNLKPILTDYDLVFAANLIDRLYEPARFVDTIHTRILPGGLLMIASPYTWLEQHTPKAHWLGGYKKDAERYTTLDGLKAHLEPHFTLLDEPLQVPFVIRETGHKFQHTLSEMTVWERKADTP